MKGDSHDFARHRILLVQFEGHRWVVVKVLRGEGPLAQHLLWERPL